MSKDEIHCHHWKVPLYQINCVDLLTKPRFWLLFDYNKYITNIIQFFIMTTVLNRDSIQVKRDLQRRIEDYVIKYCETLEENFKQYSINSYKRNIQEQRFPENTKCLRNLV